jgi:MSHA biogenesis protein MshQ
MAISFVSAGAQSNAVSALSMAQPVGLAAGDLLLCSISNKYSGITPPVPTGYTLLTSATGGAGSDASVEDEGSVRTSIYYRIATGAESGNLAVTVTGANVSSGGILCFRNTSKQWSILTSTASRNTGGTPWSVTSDGSLSVDSGKMFVAINGENSSLHAGGTTATVQIAAGNILASTTKFFDTGTSLGSNIRSCGHYGLANVTTSGTITYSTVMAGTTTATHPAGATVFLIITEDPAIAPPVTKSSLNLGFHI